MSETRVSRFGLAFSLAREHAEIVSTDETDSWTQWLALGGVILFILVPGSLLAMLDIPYSSPGGSYLVKFHPSSYLILLAAMLALAKATDRVKFQRAIREESWLIFYLGALLMVMLYTAYRFGFGGAGFYIDTLLIPGILAVILLMGTERHQRLVFYVLVVLSVVNSILGLVESATEWHMITYTIEGEPAKEEYFRATALSNHPLESAQRTVAMLFAAFVLPLGFRVVCIPVLMLSLLAFGSRSALVLGVVFMMIWLIMVVVNLLYTRRLSINWLIISIPLLIAVVGIGIGIAVWLELGNRIFETLFWDESAASRIESVLLVNELSTDQLLLGIGADGLAALESAHGHWFNIENFWVVLLLQLGVIMFCLFAAGLLSIFFFLARKGPLVVRLSVLAYLIAASSNDALSHKTPNLGIVVATWIGATAVWRKEHGQSGPTGDGDPVFASAKRFQGQRLSSFREFARHA